MAISRVIQSSIAQGFPKSRSFLAGNSAYDPAATFLIARVTAAGGETSLTFSSIPNTYKSLQIRGIGRRAEGTGLGASLRVRVNSDTAANYAYHQLLGGNPTGGSPAVTAAGVAATASAYIADATFPYGDQTNIFGVALIDILDYASTTKAKTLRGFFGTDNNSLGAATLGSMLWTSTTNITTLTLDFGGGTFAAGSTFALYGMV